MMMKDLLSKNIVLEEAYKTKKDTISVIQEDKMDSINVSKIDKKRVSLYDFGYKTGAITRS